MGWKKTLQERGSEDLNFTLPLRTMYRTTPFAISTTPHSNLEEGKEGRKHFAPTLKNQQKFETAMA